MFPVSMPNSDTPAAFVDTATKWLVTAPRAAPGPLAELRHPVEDLVDLLDDIGAVDDERAVSRHAQRHVKHRTVLGHVDPLAAEHGLATLRHPAFGRERDQQIERLGGDAVLRVVEVQAGSLRCQPVATAWIRREKVAQVHVADLVEVSLQRLPGRALVGRAERHRAAFSAWPPNCLRIADRTLSAKSSRPRDAKRE